MKPECSSCRGAEEKRNALQEHPGKLIYFVIWPSTFYFVFFLSYTRTKYYNWERSRYFQFGNSVKPNSSLLTSHPGFATALNLYFSLVYFTVIEQYFLLPYHIVLILPSPIILSSNGFFPVLFDKFVVSDWEDQHLLNNRPLPLSYYIIITLISLLTSHPQMDSSLCFSSFPSSPLFPPLRMDSSTEKSGLQIRKFHFFKNFACRIFNLSQTHIHNQYEDWIQDKYSSDQIINHA